MPLVIYAPSLPDQVQQGFWSGADAGDEPMANGLALPITGCRPGDNLHAPAAARPVGPDVLLSFPATEVPCGVVAVPFRAISCMARDVLVSLELGVYLLVVGYWVRFDGQGMLAHCSKHH